MKSAERKQIFISYSRSDGAEWAVKIRDFLSRIDKKFWQDIHDIIGDHDNWSEVKNGIDGSEHLVIIVTEKALGSTWVKKEFKYALQNGINVCPVIVDNSCIDKLEGWLKNRQYYIFEREVDRNRLLGVVRESGKRNRLCTYIPDMPIKYVNRDVVAKVKDRLIDKYGNAVKSIVALVGSGGYGKTVAAKALCEDDDISLVYSGGVIPIVIGNDFSFASKEKYEAKIVSIIDNVIYDLKGLRSGLTSIEAVSNELAKILSACDNILLFIDDIWRESDLRHFMRVSNNCSIIITTRNRRCLEGNIDIFDVGEFTEDEGFELISFGLPGVDGYDEKYALKKLSKKLYGWAQLIAIANRWLLKKCQKDMGVVDAVDFFVRSLDKKGYKNFDHKEELDRDKSLCACIDVSIDVLSDADKDRFYELSIFPEDEDLPFGIVFMLWKKTGELDEDDCLSLCEYFYDSSLFDFFSFEKKSFHIHDNILKYLRDKIAGVRRSQINEILIKEICYKFPDGFSSIPVSEKYLWDKLIWHLSECGKFDEIKAVLLDYDWVRGKIIATNSMDLYASYLFLEGDDIIARIGQAIGLSLHLIDEYSASISVQLWSRLAYYEDIGDFLSNLKSECFKRPLFFLYPSLTPPGLQKIRLSGFDKSYSVVSAMFSEDDIFVLANSDIDEQMICRSDTGGVVDMFQARVDADDPVYYSNDHVFYARMYDGMFRVSSLLDKKVILDIEMEYFLVQGCVFSEDKKRMLLWTDSKKILLYNLESGLLLATYNAREDVVGAKFSNHGYRSLIAFSNGSLLYFKTQLFDEYKEFCLGDRKITKFFFLPNDESFLGVIDDVDLCIWALDVSDKCHLLPTDGLGVVTDIVFSEKLSQIIAADVNGMISVWDLNSLSPVKCYYEHEYSISTINVSPFGDMLISASQDNTACVYNLRCNELFQVYKGHEGDLKDARFSHDQKYIVTASLDSSVRLWYVRQISYPMRYMSFHQKQVNYIDFSISGGLMATSSDDKSVKLWNLSTGELFCEPYNTGSPVLYATFSKDSSAVAALSVDGSLNVYAFLPDLKPIFKKESIDGDKNVKPLLINFSPDSNIIAVSCSDYIIRLLDAKTGDVLFFKEGHAGLINSISFSSDSKKILTSSNDGISAIWHSSAEEECVLLNGHERRINFAKYSDDNKYVLTGSNDGTARIWSPVDGKQHNLLDCTEGFDADGDVRVINGAFIGSTDYVFTYTENQISVNECYWSVRIWSLKDDKLITAFDNCPGKASMVSVSSDGRYIYYVFGKNLKVFDVNDKVFIDSIFFDADVTAFSSMNSIIGVGDRLGGVHICKFQR
ncbi:MAG: TIR domain-containing protein [Eubacteriaceae bacterium]|nr:TIR domain-containing protein [Eubacteriaceae bacterium]